MVTNTLDVSWTNGTMGTAPLLVLRSHSQQGVRGSRSQNFLGDASLQLATLTNLMAFRTYTISVFVVNAVGRNIKGGLSSTYCTV